MPIVKKISSGIGLSFFMDELGQQKTSFGSFSYSFHRKIGCRNLGYRRLARFARHTLGQQLDRA